MRNNLFKGGFSNGMNIIGRKKLYFLISFVLIIPGLFSLYFYGLNLSIEFTGGSRISLSYPKNVSEGQIGQIRKSFEEKNVKVSSVEKSDNLIFVRTSPIDQKIYDSFVKEILAKNPAVKSESFETVGPTIGAEITQNAIKAIILASILVVVYISFVFRTVPKPASSVRFGVSTVAALLHDILVVLGVFSIFGHFLNVEIDSLFITAMLTIIGFSVHDTIVVFDRIRENLPKGEGSFSK
ncbi:MAG: protein translocase subunit SecF, partial [Patescibacteria group bacterium]